MDISLFAVRKWACSLALPTALTAGAVSDGLAGDVELGPIESGHSALWYDPDRNGEGWVLEVLAGDRALLYWFTYDEHGNQRWLQGVGQIVRDASGDSIRFAELYVARGGRFGPAFDPAQVTIEIVGEATITFSDCDRGAFSYTAFGQSQSISIQRLTKTMAAGCAPIHGVPGEPVRAYAGQSGSWFDLSHNGEGFSLQWLSRDEAVLTWYSYDAQGNPYWMIGVGRYEDGRIVFPALNATRGARFGEAFDPAEVELIDWGSLVMELDCAAGTADYDSPLPGFGAGDFELARLTKLERPDCPWVAPKLTDLYEITWNEIPIPPGDPLKLNNFLTGSVADDGTIAAPRLLGEDTEEGFELALWRPKTGKWEVVPRRAFGPFLISPDGGAVLGTEWSGTQDDPINMLIWRHGSGWEPLPGFAFDISRPYGVSHDFSRIVGLGILDEPPVVAWMWDAENGQRELFRGGTPLAVSNDGRIAVGESFGFPPGIPLLAYTGIRWDDGTGLSVLGFDHVGAELSAAVLCDDECRIIVGTGQADFFPNHPHYGQAWFWTNSTGTVYLGSLADADEPYPRYIPHDLTSDGSLVVGRYTIATGEDASIRSAKSLVHPAGLPVISGDVRGFIWTQNTGIVSVRTLIGELEIGDDHWEAMSAISASSNGHRILLSGRFPSNQSEPSRWRVVVLELTPKR